MENFTKEWIRTKLTHHVSLAGADEFWKLSFKYVGDMLRLKEAENVTKGVPQFVHMRRLMYKDQTICPEVKMSFVFMNKNDGTIHYIQEGQTPLKNFQRDTRFIKMYEEAHIEV